LIAAQLHTLVDFEAMLIWAGRNSGFTVLYAAAFILASTSGETIAEEPLRPGDPDPMPQNRKRKKRSKLPLISLSSSSPHTGSDSGKFIPSFSPRLLPLERTSTYYGA